MITNKKEFSIGLVLMIGFLVVLVLIFSPVFNGKNGLVYLDSLYNSISKGSAYYIPKVQKNIEPYMGKNLSVTISLSDEKQAGLSSAILMKNGVMVNLTGTKLKILGDLGAILKSCLDDSDQMYANNGEIIKAKYGLNEREAMYSWYIILKGISKELTKQGQFEDTKIITNVLGKALEPSYNYYGVKAEKIMDKAGIVLLSLVFYVIYTIWYGFSVMFMLEGLGFRLE